MMPAGAFSAGTRTGRPPLAAVSIPELDLLGYEKETQNHLALGIAVLLKEPYHRAARLNSRAILRT
jgi:hypothetical protein